MIYNMLPQAGSDLPKGVIVMWSGAVDAVPDSWALCDGTNGTPDLRGRFALGAGSSYAVGNAGGEEKHKLTVDEMPGHGHSGVAATGGSHGHTVVSCNGPKWLDYTMPVIDVWPSTDHCPGATDGLVSGGNHSHTLTINNTGGSQPHNNMPPYYALAYIMKL